MTLLLREAEHPELLLNSVGAEAAQQREVPTLHLQHQEMRSPRVGPDVIIIAATPGSARGSRCWRGASGASLVLSPPWLLGSFA